ncbi:MAG: hypothetical protein VXW97_05565 [Pseudomonadota bacterium]|nr:hypothetical protein [Pseudomonadota bacterium]
MSEKKEIRIKFLKEEMKKNLLRRVSKKKRKLVDKKLKGEKNDNNV